MAKHFISEYTEGWNELKLLLKDYPPELVARLADLREEDISFAAQWIGAAREFTSFWTMGLNQSTHGTWQTNAICHLHLATGKICRPGSGPFSLTGQPNAMGGREVGYLSHTLPGQRSVADADVRAAVEKNCKAIRYLNSENNSAAQEIIFPTKSGRAQFFARPYLPPAEQPGVEFPFVLTNGRVEHQWHTMTKTGKVAKLNQLNPSVFLQIHPPDAEQLGVLQGALVRVTSRRGLAIYSAQVTTRVRPGECFARFIGTTSSAKICVWTPRPAKRLIKFCCSRNFNLPPCP